MWDAGRPWKSPEAFSSADTRIFTSRFLLYIICFEVYFYQKSSLNFDCYERCAHFTRCQVIRRVFPPSYTFTKDGLKLPSIMVSSRYISFSEALVVDARARAVCGKYHQNTSEHCVRFLDTSVTSTHLAKSLLSVATTQPQRKKAVAMMGSNSTPFSRSLCQVRVLPDISIYLPVY